MRQKYCHCSEKSNKLDSDANDHYIDFSVYSKSTVFKWLVESLIEKRKRAVIWNFEYDYWIVSIFYVFFFGNFGLYCFWCRIQKCFLFNRFADKSKSFLNEISMDEITPGVTEKFEFQNWYESKFITRLPIFQTIRILMQRPKRKILHRNSLPLFDTFNRAFDGNLRPRSYGEMFNLKGKPHQR